MREPGDGQVQETTRPAGSTEKAGENIGNTGDGLTQEIIGSVGHQGLAEGSPTTLDSPMIGHGRMTDGVKTLLGEPKQAIVKLAIPMMLAMTVQTVYNVVDAFWVSWLGADALSAVGFFFPFYMMSMAIGMGLGVGGGSAISRRIGARDSIGADKVASHTMVILLMITVVYTALFIILIEWIFRGIGSGDITGEAVTYARIMFSGSLVIFFMNVGNNLLRSEGDAKRAMQAIVLGSSLNIILDPIFIYDRGFTISIFSRELMTIHTLGLGIAGAAYATVLSIAIASLLIFNWLFFKKDTFVHFHFKGFRFEWTVVKDIMRVGLPAFIQFLSMSIMMLSMNFILVEVGGTDAVGVFSTGWRIIIIATTPVFGIASAVTAVAGAAYGAKQFRKVDTSYMYALGIGVKLMIPASVIMFLLAPYISTAFTLAEDTERIRDDLTLFLRISCLFYPAIAMGPVSSSLFQGTGKGMYALIVTLIRTLFLAVPIVALFAILLDLGLPGVFWGITVGNLLGAFLSFTWARWYIKKLLASGETLVCEGSTT